MPTLRLLFSNFTILIIAVVAAATIMPVQGRAAWVFEWITSLAIALLFFLHGAKLSRAAIVAGVTHWRLHLLVFGCTFIMFPFAGWLLKPVLEPLLGGQLYIGMLYLCALPGTVQSAIAFTSIARGNVPAAICSASASSLIGIVLTPLLLNLVLESESGTGSVGNAIVHISAQLLLPFLAGHLLRPWIGSWIDRNRSWLVGVDQTSILLVVYTAFSASVIAGLWRMVPVQALLFLAAACTALLALAICTTTLLARRLGFSREDEIAIVFCGSKKSMATGVPMAQVLFSGSMVGPALLPLMLFHQIQLMVCAVLAQQYAKRTQNIAAASVSPMKG